MSKILFIYNDYNDIKGIASVMKVAEQYALSSNKGKFWVNGKPNPSIQFESGETVTILPVTKGIPQLLAYDEIYIDDSIDGFIDTTRYSAHNVKFYNQNGIKY